MTYGAISGAPSRFGFIRFGQNFLPQGPEAGGEVIMAVAGADLVLGDVVYWSDAWTVAKSATNALYALFAGVVVGGAATQWQAVTDEGAVGVLPCAATGQEVLIQVAGVALCKLAAGQTVVAPQVVGVGTTSGRVLTVSTGFSIGIAFSDQATAAGVVYVQLRPSTAIGVSAGITLNDLTDVTITAGSNGDTLQLNGGQWINRPMGALINVGVLTSGDVLTYNGTNWIAQAP